MAEPLDAARDCNILEPGNMLGKLRVCNHSFFFGCLYAFPSSWCIQDRDPPPRRLLELLLWGSPPTSPPNTLALQILSKTPGPPPLVDMFPIPPREEAPPFKAMLLCGRTFMGERRSLLPDPLEGRPALALMDGAVLARAMVVLPASAWFASASDLLYSICIFCSADISALNPRYGGGGGANGSGGRMAWSSDVVRFWPVSFLKLL